MAENKHLNYVVAVMGYIWHEGKYLLIERGPLEWAAGTLAAPGGGIEAVGVDHNLLEDELRREVLEEVGVTIGTQIEYVFSKAFMSEHSVPIMAVYFLCEYGSGEAHVADPDEVASAEWLTYDEIMQDPRSPEWTLHDTRMIEQARRLNSD